MCFAKFIDSIYCRSIVVMLIFLMGITTSPAYSSAPFQVETENEDRSVTLIAFAGFTAQGINESDLRTLNNRFASFLREREDIRHLQKSDIGLLLPDGFLHDFYGSPSEQKCSEILDLTDTNYFLGGYLEQTLSESGDQLNRGYAYRCSKTDQPLVRMQLRFFMDEYNESMLAVKNQLIDSIQKPRESFLSRHLTGIIIIGAATIAAGLLFFASGSGGLGDGGAPGPTPPP